MGRREKKRRRRDDHSVEQDNDDEERHAKHRRAREESPDEDRQSRKRRKRDDSDEDRKTRKHRKREASDDERRKRKHRKKSRRNDDDDKESRSRKKKDKKKKKEKSEQSHRPMDLIPLGDPLGTPPSKLLDPEADYFAYHEHLWVFLFRERGLAFNDMTSEETRDAFRSFVKRYNRGDLQEGYYMDKLPAAVLEESKTTKHSWSFRISMSEGRSLQKVGAGVRKQTEYRDPEASNVPKKQAMLTAQEKPVYRTREEIAQERAANRRLKEHVRTAEEEFGGGRKEGRERMIEKRKEVGSRTHGASRDREAVATAPEVGDDVLYGGDDRQQFARAKKRAAHREESRGMRLNELQSKEKERQEAMFKQLGLTNMKPGEKITIKPRNDG